MIGAAQVTDPLLEKLARIIDPPAWMEHDDLIARADGWARANADRPDEAFARMEQGRRRDAAELVRMSLTKAGQVKSLLAAHTDRAAHPAIGYGRTPAEAREALDAQGGGHG